MSVRWDENEDSISVRKVSSSRSRKASVGQRWLTGVGAALIDSAVEEASGRKVVLFGLDRGLDVVLGVASKNTGFLFFVHLLVCDDGGALAELSNRAVASGGGKVVDNVVVT